MVTGRMAFLLIESRSSRSGTRNLTLSTIEPIDLHQIQYHHYLQANQ
jgi:hypothetical protein